MNVFSPFFRNVMLLLLFAITFGVAPVRAHFDELAVLNPKTYHAPAGKFAITVDPSDRYGRGEATYRCDENGQLKWTATLPFTLWDAGIADDGTVGGYAYTRGLDGLRDEGEFVIVILDPKGDVRLKDNMPRAVRSDAVTAGQFSSRSPSTNRQDCVSRVR